MNEGVRYVDVHFQLNAPVTYMFLIRNDNHFDISIAERQVVALGAALEC